jgi:hypothetical protein
VNRLDVCSGYREEYRNTMDKLGIIVYGCDGMGSVPKFMWDNADEIIGTRSKSVPSLMGISKDKAVFINNCFEADDIRRILSTRLDNT